MLDTNMQLTKSQVQTILNNAPAGTDKTQILTGLIEKGYDLEGVDSNAVKQIISQKTQTDKVNQTQPTTQTEEDILAEKNPLQKVGDSVKDFTTGVGKGAVSTAFNLGSFILKSLSSPFGANIPGTAFPTKKITKVPDIIESGVKTKNTAEDVGKISEQIAELFIPVGLENKVASKLAEIPEISAKAPSIVKFLTNLGKFGAKSVAGGTEMAGKTYIQTGGDTEKSLEAGAIQTAIPLAENILKFGGKAIAESVIPVSAKEAKAIQSYKAGTSIWDRLGSLITGVTKKTPSTAGKTAFEKGLIGTESMIGVGAKKTSNNLWNKIINPSLQKSETKINMTSFFDDVEANIVKNNPEISRQNDLLEGLRALRDDYAKIGDVSLKDLQNYKEGWAELLPDKVYRGKSIAGAFNEVKNIAAGTARNKIYDNLGQEVKQAYFDYGNLVGLQELGQKSMTGSKLKGGFGGFWNAVKDMAIVPVGTIGGQTIYKTGQGIELFGKAGGKVISDIIDNPNVIYSEQSTKK